MLKFSIFLRNFQAVLHATIFNFWLMSFTTLKVFSLIVTFFCKPHITFGRRKIIYIYIISSTKIGYLIRNCLEEFLRNFCTGNHTYEGYFCCRFSDALPGLWKQNQHRNWGSSFLLLIKLVFKRLRTTGKELCSDKPTPVTLSSNICKLPL